MPPIQPRVYYAFFPVMEVGFKPSILGSGVECSNTVLPPLAIYVVDGLSRSRKCLKRGHNNFNLSIKVDSLIKFQVEILDGYSQNFKKFLNLYFSENWYSLNIS
jgi:hypothetical protein